MGSSKIHLSLERRGHFHGDADTAFVWLIFLGTAYTFVFQRTWDRIRTRMIGKALEDHHIVCRFSWGGEAAVTELIRRGNAIIEIVPVAGGGGRDGAKAGG